MHGTVDDLTGRNRVRNTVEELSLTTHDVNLRRLKSLSHHDRLLLRHLTLDIDLREFDLLLLLELELELFVLLSCFFEELHRSSLLLDCSSISLTLRTEHLSLTETYRCRFLSDRFCEELLSRCFLLRCRFLCLREDDTLFCTLRGCCLSRFCRLLYSIRFFFSLELSSFLTSLCFFDFLNEDLLSCRFRECYFDLLLTLR